MASPGLRKGHHCAYDIHYHFVFVVRYRRALLRPEVEAELVRLSHEIGERYEIEIEGIGADQNHVHLLCSAHPKIGPGDIARIYKSITAPAFTKALPLSSCSSHSPISERSCGAASSGRTATMFRRLASYVSTIGLKGGWPALVRYIQQQGKTPEATNLRFLFPTTDAATKDK